MAKTRLDVSDIVQSPEWIQTIEIIRDTGGSWYQGVYTKVPQKIITTGVVSATDERDIQFIPEGDRASETKTIHVTIPVYTTRDGPIGYDADKVSWNDELYKVIRVQNSGDYGYWKAIISLIDSRQVELENNSSNTNTQAQNDTPQSNEPEQNNEEGGE